MKKFSFAFLLLCCCMGMSVGCSDSGPTAIEQTMTQEEIDKQDAEYEAEMEAAENDADNG